MPRLIVQFIYISFRVLFISKQLGQEIVQNVKDINDLHYGSYFLFALFFLFFFYGAVRSVAQLEFEICSFATHCFLRFE